MNQTDLSQFRTSLPGCELALLADIEARTCLLAAGAIDVGQEQLDGLCLEAALALNGLPPQPERFCLMAHAAGIRVFVRLGENDPETLCLAFAPGASLDGVEPAAHALLSQSLDEEL